MNTNSPISMDTLIALITANVKTGKWINSTFQVTTERGTFGVGVKAYGLWLQRVECCGLCDGNPAARTQRQFKDGTRDLIERMLRSA